MTNKPPDSTPPKSPPPQPPASPGKPTPKFPEPEPTFQTVKGNDKDRGNKGTKR